MGTRRGQMKHFFHVLVLVVGIVLLFTGAAEARSVIRNAEPVTIKAGSSYTMDFTTKEPMIFQTPIEFFILDNGKKLNGGLHIKLYNEDGKVLQNDLISLEGYDVYDWYTDWYYSDGFEQPPGNYTYEISNSTKLDIKVMVPIMGYDKVCEEGDFEKSVKVKGGYEVQIGQLDVEGLPYTEREDCSDESVVEYVYTTPEGGVYAYGYKPGTATVTIELLNGKTYTTKVTVTNPDPNFRAKLMTYNKKKNYFTVRFENMGIETLTILPTGAKASNYDKKSRDRNLYLKNGKAVKIKPGTTKTVTFRVKGSATWSDVKDFRIFYKFSYYKKTYKAQAHYDAISSSYKVGKEWDSTYW